MKTIRIPVEIKILLEEFADGDSINKAMKRLLQDVETNESLDTNRGTINIHMDEDVYDKLTACRLYPTESYGSVIYRLLQSQE